MSEVLGKGLALTRDAVAADMRGDLDEALRAYRLAVDLLRQAQTEAQAPEVLAVLPTKIKEYQQRIDALELEITPPGLDLSILERTLPPRPIVEKSVAVSKTQYSPLDLEFYEAQGTAASVSPTSPAPTGSAIGTPTGTPTPAGTGTGTSTGSGTRILSESDPASSSSTSSVDPSQNLLPSKGRVLSSMEEVDPADQPSPAQGVRKVGRRGEIALERALALAKEGRSLDFQKRYPEAFIAYMQSLEYFSDAARHAPVGILTALNEKMAACLTRAEVIKLGLMKQGIKPEVPVVELESEESVNEYHDRVSPTSNIDGRIGITEKTTVSSFWNDKNPYHLSVKIDRNMVPLGGHLTVDVRIVNETAVVTDSIRIYLMQWTTLTDVAANGKKLHRSSSRKINQIYYRDQRKFPLDGHRRYAGRVRYDIPREVEITESDHSASYALEYEVAVQCELVGHKNLGLAFPIRLYPVATSAPEAGNGTS